MNNEEFIAKSKELHGDKYDYSKTLYVNTNTKVCIICPKHGEFWQTPKNHLHNHGCPLCAIKNVTNNNKSNEKEFIAKAKEIHGDKYDYSKVEYVNTYTKIRIICPEHGEFWQTPKNHLHGHGCPKCGGKEKYTNESFIAKAKEVHGDKYIYDNIIYVNHKKPILIECPQHGFFSQRPHDHLRGHGCPICKGEECSQRQTLTLEEFIQRAKEIHGDKYDYSKTEYVNIRTKVCIICPKHGEFWQTPNDHINNKVGCPQCGRENMTQKNKSNKEEFIARAKEIHGDKYDYSKVEYINSRTKVCIICPTHGEFWQSPRHHLQGQGCKYCSISTSKPENEIYDFVCSLVGKENVIHRDRTVLNGKELDIYVPNLNIAIEYNGLFWHSEENISDTKYHLNKLEECNSKGIYLLQIFEDEFLEKHDIVMNKIRHILKCEGAKERIMGRKCEIKEIKTELAKDFLDKNHIQGVGSATINVGGFYNGKLIAVMTFKKEWNDKELWDLTRFATDNNYVCQGIGGKLFKYFTKQYNPERIKSFADRRWTIDTENNLYVKLGFTLAEKLPPDYRYVVGKKRVHKFHYRKKNILKEFGIPYDYTEKEAMKMVGIPRIYDCGLIRFEWYRKD